MCLAKLVWYCFLDKVKQADDELSALKGPASFSDRWLGWHSQSQEQV